MRIAVSKQIHSKYIRRCPSMRFVFAGLAMVALANFVGCSRNEGDQIIAPLADLPSGVLFAYPVDGQQDVPSGARALIRFAQAVGDTELGGLRTYDASGSPAPLEFRNAPGDPTIAEASTENLEAGAGYRIENAQGETISRFRMRYAAGGDQAASAAPGTLRILRRTPAPDAALYFMDHSTIRILFSEAIDPELAARAFRVLAPGGASVPGELFIQGARLSFDPTDDLIAGAPYTVQIDSQLRGESGALFPGASYSVTPRASGQAGRLALVMDASRPISPLAGRAVNRVDVNSVLTGSGSAVQVGGGLRAELADLAVHDEVLPFVVRKDNELLSDSLAVMLGGAIPAGLATGDMSIALISDMNGYIIGNPYSANQDSPIHARVVFDAVLTPRDRNASGGLTQTILHVEAAGTLEVVDGSMLLDLVGAMNFEVLGLDTAVLNFNFRLSTPEFAPAHQADRTPPRVLSTSLNSGDLVSPATIFDVDAPISVHFSEAIREGSLRVNETIRLRRVGGGDLDFRFRLQGSRLNLQPTTPLAAGAAYELHLGAALLDTAGNPLDRAYRFDFSVPAVSANDPRPAYLTGIYPGTSCALTDGNANSGGSDNGRCAGGRSSDDRFAVFELPANRPLDFFFSRPLRRSSIVAGASCGAGSLRVEAIDASGNCTSAVAGEVRIEERRIRFQPRENWNSGARYRVTLVAGANGGCDTGEICDDLNRAFNSDPLSNTNGGGPNLVYVFGGIAAARSIYTPLLTRPISDYNGNDIFDADESPRDENRAALNLDGHSGIISSASLPGERRLFLSTVLPVEIASPNAAGRMPVTVHPQALFGTSIDLRAVALGFITLNIATGKFVLRVREATTGFIDAGPDGIPRFSITLPIYLDAPELRILGGLAEADLESKPLSITLAGPITFLDDGRIEVTLDNPAAVLIDVGISVLGFGAGGLDLSIPAGELRVRLLSELIP